MADSLASAWVEVLPDFKEFKKSANGEMSSILGDAGDVGGKRAGTGVSAGILGGITGAVALGALSIAGDLGRLVGNAIGTGISFALDGIDLASSLAEQKNAVLVSFGETADEILALGSGALDRLFLSELSFDKIAVQFSSFAKTIAGDGGNVAGVIDELTQRGADFASVYDLETSEALALFQSALAGESEPLRAFGKDLSAATVAQYAYANGLAAQGAQLTEAQRIQATYGSLLQQTNDVQGDLANTSGSYAGQQKKLNEALVQAQTALGTYLLPTFTELVTLANEQLIPALGEVIEEIGPDLASALHDSMPAFGELLTAIVPLLPELVKLGVSILPPLLQLLIALSPLLIDWAANTTTVLEAAQALIAFFAGETTLEETGNKLEALGGSFGDFARLTASVLATTSAGFNDLATDVGSGVNQMLAFVGSVPAGVTNAFIGIGTTLYKAGQDLMTGFINGIQSMATKLAEAALKPVKDAVTGVKGFLGIKSPSKLYEQLGIYTMQGYVNGVEGMTGKTVSTLQSAVEVPSVPAYGASSTSVLSSSGITPQWGGFVNYGTIQVTDEAALIDEVEKRKRRSYAGLSGLKVA